MTVGKLAGVAIGADCSAADARDAGGFLGREAGEDTREWTVGETAGAIDSFDVGAELWVRGVEAGDGEESEVAWVLLRTTVGDAEATEEGALETC